jgi:hypothetical protein
MFEVPRILLLMSLAHLKNSRNPASVSSTKAPRIDAMAAERFVSLLALPEPSKAAQDNVAIIGLIVVHISFQCLQGGRERIPSSERTVLLRT